MDWLEQLFGMNPDGGDGSMEALLMAAAALVALTVVVLAVPRLRALAADVMRRTVAGVQAVLGGRGVR